MYVVNWAGKPVHGVDFGAAHDLRRRTRRHSSAVYRRSGIVSTDERKYAASAASLLDRASRHGVFPGPVAAGSARQGDEENIRTPHSFS
jgi:hypothetical protein